MRTPSSRHLSYDFPAYKGLTLRELFMIVMSFTVFITLLFGCIGFLLHWTVAFSCLGFLLGFIFAITLLPKPIARLKAGKPHGYLAKLITLKLTQLRLKQSPYIHHVGHWQRSATLRRPRV